MTQTTEFISTILNTGLSSLSGSTKQCSWCKKVHPVEHFNFTYKAAGKRHSHCKDCTRAASRARSKDPTKKSSRDSRWGISNEERNRIMDLYGAKCGVCSSTERHELCLDHDHDTNEIRGVLCTTCNSGIGFLGDDVKRVEKAHQYLLKHHAGQEGFTIKLRREPHNR